MMPHGKIGIRCFSVSTDAFSLYILSPECTGLGSWFMQSKGLNVVGGITFQCLEHNEVQFEHKSLTYR